METRKKRNENMVDRFQFISPIVIAGPCSAETEEQVLKIAHELKDSDVSVLERNLETKNTGGFEGVGEIGLKWLKKSKKRQDC
jgi:chorismate mutase